MNSEAEPAEAALRLADGDWGGREAGAREEGEKGRPEGKAKTLEGNVALGR